MRLFEFAPPDPNALSKETLHKIITVLVTMSNEVQSSNAITSDFPMNKQEADGTESNKSFMGRIIKLVPGFNQQIFNAYYEKFGSELSPYIENFDENTITIKAANVPEQPASAAIPDAGQQGADRVAQMANRAAGV
jgi:hypothetical protein